VDTYRKVRGVAILMGGNTLAAQADGRITRAQAESDARRFFASLVAAFPNASFGVLELIARRDYSAGAAAMMEVYIVFSLGKS